ncbi:hypothetical protein BGZ57DRAFT_12434 [Hyaloscypha finlandica]|nr:hypothetical protein BGZ57DRAFT_12434 [Hyaloscypha finlandica]
MVAGKISSSRLAQRILCRRENCRAIGGRPNKPAIQGIGATTGANNSLFGYIRQITALAMNTRSTYHLDFWPATTGDSELPLNRSTNGSINVRDNILRDHLEDGIPA